MSFSVRTDLAAEARRLWQRSAEDAAALPGVLAREETVEGLPVFAVDIIKEEGARALGKAIGRYYALQLPEKLGRGSEAFPAAVRALAALLRRCMERPPRSVLVAALGNPDITPDALGCLAAESVLVTRHLKREDDAVFAGFCSLALCRPGVLGTTGVESAAQVAMLCRALSPELVIAVDALAGAEAESLCRTVQVTDAGICPGSGVGNDRQELSRRSLGVPVISVGMPTVIDAASLGGEGVDSLFVTPRDIDRQGGTGGRLIGCAVDLAVHPGISLADIDALTD